MEDPRCKIAAVQTEDPRCNSLLRGVVIEIEYHRCKGVLQGPMLAGVAIEMEDPRCQRVAIEIEDPRCQSLLMMW